MIKDADLLQQQDQQRFGCSLAQESVETGGLFRAGQADHQGGAAAFRAQVMGPQHRPLTAESDGEHCYSEGEGRRRRRGVGSPSGMAWRLAGESRAIA